MRDRTRRFLPLALMMVLVLVPLLVPIAAMAHREREVEFPDGTGSVPKFRTSGPSIVVCKKDTLKRISTYPPKLKARNKKLNARCRFHNIQAAVDAAKRPKTRILIQPGRYLERPSLKPASDKCADAYKRAEDDDTGNDTLTFEDEQKCRHAKNLIAILGDGSDKDIKCDGALCKMQLEGTGKRPEDVVIDGQFKKLNVIRSDRADGAYFKNFTVQHSHFNGLYVMQQDGFVIDKVLGRWNDEYGFLTFAVDHGLYKNCEAHGNGDSGVYPGGEPSFHGTRYSVEIKHCRSHHNLLGYSGTGGDSVYVHDNRFWDNTVGISMDSFVGGHPGVPQNSTVIEDNLIYSNNQDFYKYWDDGTCNKPSAERGYEKGVVCPTFGVPIGTGILTAGGNENIFGMNHIYNNWRYGTMLLWVPAGFRGEDDPEKQYDTSHFNRYFGNFMSTTPDGKPSKNGLDFWWDEEGAGNCWMSNTSAAGEITSDPSTLPECGEVPVFSTGNTAKTGLLAPCATWSPDNNHPPNCDWIDKPNKPE
ncbi:MAG: right-handed parallel beta-helix repeat-containing protein [Actinobacteria bacterium]|nr:right-handed parallel beta-helix repeat-containing protein [Actinomycetota bacterium]